MEAGWRWRWRFRQRRRLHSPLPPLLGFLIIIERVGLPYLTLLLKQPQQAGPHQPQLVDSDLMRALGSPTKGHLQGCSGPALVKGTEIPPGPSIKPVKPLVQE